MAKDDQTFEDLLHELDGGACCSGLTRVLREILANNAEIARDNGKAKGELTLKLTFNTAGQGGMTDVSYTVNGKPAPRPAQKTTLYALHNGGFSSRDPRQEPLRFAGSTKAGAQS